jgi:sec-independent protein translocase protein TatB
MDIFGIGASEFVFIILIAIIILGPKDMQKAGRTIGRWLNQLVRSDGWKIFQRTSSEIRNLPRTLMREANMEMMEAEKDLRRAIDPRSNSPVSHSTPSEDVTPSNEPENPSLNEPPDHPTDTVSLSTDPPSVLDDTGSTSDNND